MKKQVLKRMRHQTLQSVFKQIRKFKPAFWGTQRPRNFQKKVVVAALYKDMYGVSFGNITQEISRWLKADVKTHSHNFKICRKIFSHWAAAKIKLGSLDEWKKTTQATIPKAVKDPPHLFMDSSDFRQSGKKSMSRKDTSWSYKCNGPGRRYMSLTDANGEGKYISNGYSPKLYDAHWVQARKEWVEQTLAGATIYADNHFRSAASDLKDVNLVASKAKPSKKSGRKLDIDDKLLNKCISSCRGRVESPFGIMQNKFCALSKAFYEGNQQLDYLVTFAFGVVAFEKQQ